MANIFDVTKVFRPRRVILAEDQNTLQVAIRAAFNKLGEAAPVDRLGVSTPFAVGTATEPYHAVTKERMDTAEVGAAASAAAAAASEAGVAASATSATNSATAAAASATAASGSASAASTSATNAAASASGASTSATNAATSATNASTSATSSATSATSSSTSATAALASENAAATSATNAATSATSSGTSATNSAGSASASASSATAADVSAAAALASQSAAATSETAAQTTVTNAAGTLQAAVSADRVLAESAAATATAKANEAAQIVSNDAIALIETQFNYAAVQKAIYVSNIGPWRTRGRGLSWYDTTKPTVLVGQNTSAQGQYATAALAVAAGGLVGEYFYNTTSKFWEKITATSTPASTRIYAAGQVDFPAEVVIVVVGIGSATRLLIHDATVAGCPMWMEFLSGSGFHLGGSGNISSIVLNAGILVAARDGGGALHLVVFPADKSLYYDASSYRQKPTKIADRNAVSTLVTLSNSIAIPSATVNALATYTAPDAPIDTVSGEPIAVIGGVTAGGPFVILEDGTVQKASSTSEYNSIYFDKNGTMYVTTTTAVRLYVTAEQTWRTASWNVAAIAPLTETTLTNAANTLISIDGENTVISKHASGIDLVRLNPNAPAQSLIQKIGTTFNTGPYIDGAGTAAVMCGTDTGGVADTQLVTNGTFDTDIAGWSNVGTNTITWSTGAAVLTRAIDSGSETIASQLISVTAGKMYRISYSGLSGVTGSSPFGVYINTTLVGQVTNNTAIDFIFTATTTGNVTFALAIRGTTPSGAPYVVGVDNVGMKEVVSDHSGNANHFDVVGTLTRTAINALPDAIAAYSGFSAANYLSSTDADLNVSGKAFTWPILFKASGATNCGLIGAGDANIAEEERYLYINGASGALQLFNGSVGVVSSPGSYLDGNWHAGVLSHTAAGEVFLVVDETIVGTGSYTPVAFTTPNLRVGARVNVTQPCTGSLAAFVPQTGVAWSEQQAKHWCRVMKTLIENGNVTQPAAAIAADYITRSGQTLSATATTVSRSTNTARLTNEASTVGTIADVGAGERGEIVVGGSTGLKVSVPARNLREIELPLVRIEKTFRYAANGTTVNFPDPSVDAQVDTFQGFRISSVVLNGIELDGEGSEYSIKQGLFGLEFAQFGVAPTASDIVKVKGYRYG